MRYLEKEIYRKKKKMIKDKIKRKIAYNRQKDEQRKKTKKDIRI
jgi:hypothetical protein